MAKATLYRIVDWDKHFESAQSRKVERLTWVRVPNKHDGEGYTELLDHPNGAAHYACWMAIVQVASKCQPRGSLLRDGPSAAKPASRPNASPRRFPDCWRLVGCRPKSLTCQEIRTAPRRVVAKW